MSRQPAPNRTVTAASLAALGFLAVSMPAAADDRNLLRTSSGAPYVMILFDTSGSMNWSPACSQADYNTFWDDDDDPNTPDVRRCNFVCEPRDCPVPRDGDDPNSKFRQAKEALYEVIQDVTNVQFGFMSYNQDNLHVDNKHWLYQVDAGQGVAALAGGGTWPVIGSQEVFGATFACTSGGSNIGCASGSPADTTDAWEATRVRRYAKLGTNRTTQISYYIRSGGQVYYVESDDPGAAQPYDSQISVRTRVFRCTGSPADNPSNNCNAAGEMVSIFNADVLYSLVGDFVMWDYQVLRNPPQSGYNQQVHSFADNTCEGWEPNDDTDLQNDGQDDDYPDLPGGYNLKRTTAGMTYDPPGTANDWRFTIGDVLPIDWVADPSFNRAEILRRLAPRLNAGDPATDPEAFGVATYLNDFQSAGDSFLRLKNAQRPLIPNGATPLGYSLKSFREWYRGCENGNCPQATGWDDIASVQDPNWECRKKYLIVITDGDDTCPGRDPCSLTASMKALDDIYTYVVAFGVENTPQNRLNCMAANGGTGDPIYPQNKAELVAALRALFGEIQEAAAAFASAAVPSVQANVADKIYLSSFIPLNQEAVWPGRLDAFLKPLPLNEENLPDRTRVCGADGLSECFLWDAADGQPAWDGEAGYAPQGLLLQAPTEAEVTLGDNATLKIGTGDTDRRVFFGLPNDSTAAGKRQYFRFPADAAEQNEFEWVWNLSPAPVDDSANRDVIEKVVYKSLVEKQGEITDPVTNITSHIQYVMGDIFHSNPIVMNQPSDFDYYTQNLYAGQSLCGQSVEQTLQRSPSVSYAYFADQNACRRKVLFVGSNDAQLHAFDTGIYEGPDCKFPSQADRNGDGQPDGDGDPLEGKFDNGTGREIFSFIPAQMMPVARRLTVIDDLAAEGVYGIDGNLRTADVFIDPAHNGSPTCTERQWRTILLGSYREGGPGFFVLDVTQPDTIDGSNNVPSPGGGGYVPSCADGGGQCGPLPFPAKLFEFADVDEVGGPLDDDGNGLEDLGESWSLPVVSRLRVCLSACDSGSPQLEDRFVAIFGGGLAENPSNSASDAIGNWVYMVDVETGKALYKRGGVSRAGATDAVIGSIPADIATVDFNNNGYVDTLYFGTTAGYVYKVNLGDGPFELDPTSGRILDPRKDDGSFDTGALDPFQVFSTGDRPIYYEITAIYLPKLRAAALAFGTGNRWNLWDFSSQTGRFYVIADLNWQDANRDGVIDPECGGCPTPLTESQYVSIDPDAAFDPNSPPPDYLLDYNDATPGWYLTLGTDERLITEAFSLSGITVFTAYSPIQTEEAGHCALGGESKIFIVGTVNGIGYARATGSTTRTRYFTAPTFTTQPFVEQSATKNPDSGSGGTNADQLTEELQQVKKELERLFPASCRFANYTVNIKTIRSDTGLVFIAPVPVCIEPTNWKEF